MTDEELKALVASLAVSQKHTDEKFASLAESQKLTDEKLASLAESQKQTDEQMKRTDEKLERIGIYLGNITHNQGDVAEEFFFNSLVSEPRLGSICFDDITKNMQKHRGHIQEEFDLFLTNGDAIAIIEVKYKAHTNDLMKLDRKMDNFKSLFPIYKDYKLYGALASFYINDETKQAALERGYFVLQRSGNLVHTECPTSQLKIG
ncbi:MAG: hypothetical protein R3E08_13050 [Thiotrichaceae bacterium]